MSDIDELKQRKEQLLLEQEVARLERKKRLSTGISGWRWLWVAPLAVISAVVFLVGIEDGEPVPVILGAVGLAPLIMKIFIKRER